MSVEVLIPPPITINVTELKLQGKCKRANTAEHTALEVIFVHVPKGLGTSTFQIL